MNPRSKIPAEPGATRCCGPLRTGATWAAILALALVVGGVGCGDEPDAGSAQPNILLLLVDDVSPDWIAAYGGAELPASTPSIDALAREGVLFRNAWATPMCSPTRASILTGTLPSTHGVGHAISAKRPERRQGLDLGRGLPILPRLLRERGYESFAAGKWHLGPAVPVAPRHALDAGFDHHAGTYANLGGKQDYSNYEKYVDGEREPRGVYATSDTVDDAIRFISAARKPWFGWVAFNAVHIPLHRPPPGLSPTDLRGELDSPHRRVRAMLEAVDTEIGRLLRSIDPAVLARTVVVFASDNGGTKLAFATGQRGGKGTLFERGLNVPFIVSGAAVSPEFRGKESDALVHVLDVFAAAAEWAGAALPDDSEAVSFVPYLANPRAESLRPVLFTELFTPNGGPPDPRHHLRAARDARFKLMDDSGNRALYDLRTDPSEARNLLEAPLGARAERALAELERALAGRGDSKALRNPGPPAATGKRGLPGTGTRAAELQAGGPVRWGKSS